MILVNLVTLGWRQRNLNWFLLIFKALILRSKVDGGIPSLVAAPEAPETRPLLSARAASISSFSFQASPSRLNDADASTRSSGREISLGSHNSSTEKTSPALRITDLSMTFCNSRMLPGQS